MDRNGAEIGWQQLCQFPFAREQSGSDRSWAAPLPAHPLYGKTHVSTIFPAESPFCTIILCALIFSSVQFSCSVFVTPWTAAHQPFLSITNSWSLLKLKSIESVMPSKHPILCRPLLLLPSVLPSIRVLSNESFICIRLPKYWSFSFSISPFNEYSGLISFRIV